MALEKKIVKIEEYAETEGGGGDVYFACRRPDGNLYDLFGGDLEEAAPTLPMIRTMLDDHDVLFVEQR